MRAADVDLEGFEIRGSGLDLSQDHAARPRHRRRARSSATTASSMPCTASTCAQADGARIEGNTILGTADAVGAAGRSRSPRQGHARGGGELCDASANQNRRGNGVHIWNSSGHIIARQRDPRHARRHLLLVRRPVATVRDNDIAGVRYGLHYMYSDENRFEGNVFRDNAAGAALMYSKDIVAARATASSPTAATAPTACCCRSVDELADLGTTDRRQHRRRCSSRTATATGVLGNRIDRQSHRHSRVSDSSDANRVRRQPLHRQPPSGRDDRRQPDEPSGRVDGRGNHWDGAATLDLDRNGIADLPHRELDLFGELRRELPAIGLLAGSPAERLLRFVHARLAMPGARRHRRSGAARERVAQSPDDHDHSVSPKPSAANRVLDRLDLGRTPGEVTLLVGANGCGKTTTLRLLAGLSSPDAGRIVIAGHDARRRSRMAALARLSFLPQSPRFHARLTAGADPRVLRPAARPAAVARRRRGESQWGLAEHAARARPAGCRAAHGSVSRSRCSSCPTRRCSCSTSRGSASIRDWRRFLQARPAAPPRSAAATVLVATHLLGEWNGQADRCLVLEGGRRSAASCRRRGCSRRFPVRAGRESGARRMRADGDHHDRRSPDRRHRRGVPS